ncbi:hypothetical protein M1432_01245 [Patescibacteria group bacterium]|nr:hypothetical protein [Patescibacteria group bacterium]
MENFKKRLVLDLSVAVLVIVALAAGLAFFKGNIDNYLERIAQGRSLLLSRTEAANQLALLQTQYNSSIESDLNTLNNIVPTYDSLINLNSEFQSLAAANHLGYGFSFAGQTAPNGASLGSLGYNITVTSADLNGLMTFLKSLTGFHDLSSVDNVSLHTSNGQLNLAVNGRVFYRQ